MRSGSTWVVVVGLLIVVAASLPVQAGDSPEGEPARATSHADFSQARLVLEYLREAAGGTCRAEAVDRILEEPGTGLVIGQMNLARQVTAAQYRQLLAGICGAEPPHIEPEDDSERAARGVAGLEKDVWRALQWGKAHVDVLEEHLEFFAGIDLYATAVTTAESFLPGPIERVPKVYLVMGGRAGAAALDEQVYLDLLVLTGSRAIQNREPFSREEAVEFVAHEMHHIGVHHLRAAQYAGLHLDERQSLAFGLLSSLVSEGSATYLINEHRDLEQVRANPGFAELVSRGDELFATCEGVLQSLLEGEIADREQFDRATSSMLGSAYHVAGSLLLATIDEAGGLEPVRAVIADPRRLLAEYDRAVVQLEQGEEQGSRYRFDPELVRALTRLGSEVKQS